MIRQQENTETIIQKESGNDVVIDIKGLKKSFNDKPVLNGIDLILKKGENLVVLGKSGSGKSVMIKCIMGLIEPDGGEIKVFDKNMLTLNMHDLNDIRRRVGFLFQSAALYDSMTVRENLEFPLRYKKLTSKTELDTLVQEALENVGLSDVIDKMPAELSGGMRKRLGLARTLILKPEIILYDEPTTGLDKITSSEISNLILDIQKKYKTASIIITHDMDCARLTANKMRVLKDGVFKAEGTYKELQLSKDEWVKAFFE
ncbi:MAG: ATP-binding cassette domain-containing protein [Bacteroidota bacterium]